jgi:hypothetical protein
MVDSEACRVCREAIAPGRFITVDERKMHLTCWVREYLSRNTQGPEARKADTPGGGERREPG